MKFNAAAFGLLSLVASAYADVYFAEKFEDGDGWTKRWTTSSYRADLGQFQLSAGRWFNETEYPNVSKGLQTSEDLHFYAVSAPLKSTFDNKNKDFVLQFSVRHDQKLDCGGGYVKLLKPGFDPKSFDGDTEYNIMFGPDICGSKSLVHVILNYNGKNHDMTKTISAPNDQYTHFFTLAIKPDQTYLVLVDGQEKGSGSLLDDWDLLPPKTIPDPNAKKPEDWVDEAKIPDPEDKRPEGWDDIPEYISDPDAKKPEDWDDEMDGDWEAPSIPNPDYQGEWKPKMIDNPAYKGPWEHPIIDNPDYKVDENIYAYKTSAIGIDIWQVKSGSIFDNFLITDDVKLAEKERGVHEELQKLETEAKEAFEKAEEAARKEDKPDEDTDDADEEDEVIDLDFDLKDDEEKTKSEAETATEKKPEETGERKDEL